MPFLKASGRKVLYTVQRKNIQHIYLRIDSNLKLEVILPKRENISVKRFLNANLPWIEMKVKEMSRMKRLFRERTILFKGDPLKVKTIRVRSSKFGMRNGNEKNSKGYRLYKKVLFVYENSKMKRDKILKDFITNQTLLYVKRDVRNWSRILNVDYRTLETRNMKSWGYCTHEGDLFFNWRLVCLPENLRKYIVLHELLHRRYFDHSKGFYRKMKKHIDNYMECEVMLKRYLPF
jgi:predicted metal-dependent hydrolase